MTNLPKYMTFINSNKIFNNFLTCISLLCSIVFFSFPNQAQASSSYSAYSTPVIFTATKKVVEPPFDVTNHAKNPDGLTANLNISDLGVNAPIIYSKPQDVQTADWNCLKSYRQCPMRYLLRFGILHIFGTPEPGELGNSILVGHSSCYASEKTQYCKVLQKLNNLSVGSKFDIQYSDGKKQTFEVFDNFRFYYSRGPKLAKLSDQISAKQGQVDSARNAKTKKTYQTQLNSLQLQYNRLNNGSNFDKRNAKFPNERVVTLETCWPLGTATDRWVVQAKLVDETPASQTTNP